LYVLQVLSVLRRSCFVAALAVNRIGLDVVLADHFGHRTNRLYVVMKIRDMEEARFIQADIDERRLHPGQHSRDLALIDVPGETAMLLAFEIELVQRAVFEQRNAHFERACINNNFTFHERPGRYEREGWSHGAALRDALHAPTRGGAVFRHSKCKRRNDFAADPSTYRIYH
jgi:hypothetical protein